MSLALFVSYAFIAIFITVIMVLFCISCQCSVPLRKIWLWLFSMRCCQCPRRTEAEEKRVKKAQAKQTRSMESDYQRCISWIPFVLTCGYCFGACKEEEETHSDEAHGARPLPPVVAQPVGPTGELVEIAGTEPVVAVHMPLLSL